MKQLKIWIALLLLMVTVSASASTIHVRRAHPAAGGGGGGSAPRSFSATEWTSGLTNTIITPPSGIQDGDVLLLVHLIGSAETPPTPTLPDGFTLLQGPSSVSDITGFTVTRRLAYKIASGESGNYTVIHTPAATQGLIIAVLSGDSGAPLSSDNSGTGTTSTATGLSPTTDNAFIAFIAHNWVLYGAASPPTGTTPTFTERLDAGTSLLYYADGVLETAGGTGDKSHGNLNTDPGFPWAAFLVAVEAAP